MRAPSRSRRWMIVAAAFTLVLAACGGAVEPNEVGEIEFVLTDNTISPSVVKVKAGQKVRFVIRNEGRHPHEFMIGREPHPGTDYLQGEPVYEPFEVDFFEGLEVSVTGGMPMNFEGMEDMGMGEEGMEMGEMAEEPHGGAMVMLQPRAPGAAEPGETSVIEFTIPEDRVGVWEIGCFQEAGQHFDDGMRATLIVEA